MISVIMSVYNAEPYVKDAILSILSQTYKDFEFIIINDASTDGSLSILKSIAQTDQRIKIFDNENNLGLALSLNTAISHSKGEFLARMDADDISLPYRLERQLGYMQKHPEIDIVGSFAKVFGDGKGIIKQPTGSDKIKASLLFRTSLIHPTVMIRKKFLDIYGLYYANSDDTVGYVEDFDLWQRAAKVGKIENIPEVLLLYRRHEKQVSSEHKEVEYRHGRYIIARGFEEVGIDFNDEDLDTAISLKRFLFSADPNFPKKLNSLFQRLVNSNTKSGVHDQKTLEDMCGKFWLEMGLSYCSEGNDIWKDFWHLPSRRYVNLTPKNVFRITKIFLFHLIS